VDLSRLRRGEQFVLIGSAALLILSFLSFWSKYEVLGGNVRGTAWNSLPGYAKLALFLALVALVLVLLRAAGKDLELPASYGQIYLVCGALATLLLLIAAIAGPEGSGISGLGIEVSRGPLLLISPILAALIAYGGFLTHQEGETTTTPRGPAAAPPAPPA